MKEFYTSVHAWFYTSCRGYLIVGARCTHLLSHRSSCSEKPHDSLGASFTFESLQLILPLRYYPGAPEYLRYSAQRCCVFRRCLCIIFILGSRLTDIARGISSDKNTGTTHGSISVGFFYCHRGPNQCQDVICPFKRRCPHWLRWLPILNPPCGVMQIPMGSNRSSDRDAAVVDTYIYPAESLS